MSNLNQILAQTKRKKLDRIDRKQLRRRELISSGDLNNEPQKELDLTTENELAKAFNWYSMNVSAKDRQKYILVFAKKTDDKELFKAAHRIKPTFIPSSYSSLCRLIIRECDIMDKFIERMPEYRAKFIEDSHTYALETEVKSTENKISIKDTPEQIAIGTIENLIDDYMISGERPDMKVFYLTNEYAQYVLNAVAAFYEKHLIEFKELVENPKTPLMEGYKSLSKNEILDWMKFYEDIVESAKYQVATKKVARKPRKQKVQPKEKIIKWVKFQENCAELNLVSLLPINVLDQNVLWAYNTKYKVLLRFESAQGFSFKGTTLLNLDVARGKRIRKPDEFFKEFTTTTPVRKLKMFNDIKTKENPGNPRMNQNTLMLSVK